LSHFDGLDMVLNGLREDLHDLKNDLKEAANERKEHGEKLLCVERKLEQHVITFEQHMKDEDEWRAETLLHSKAIDQVGPEVLADAKEHHVFIQTLIKEKESKVKLWNTVIETITVKGLVTAMTLLGSGTVVLYWKELLRLLGKN